MLQKGNITRISSKTAPLCFFPNGRLLCYRMGKVLVLRDGKIESSSAIIVSKKERLLGWNRLAIRLLRLGVRTAVAIDDNHAILSIGNSIHEFDLSTGVMTGGWNCGAGIRPLILTDVKSIDGFYDGLYFGGYLGNSGKKPVSIYHRTGIDHWEVVYTFPQGVINHVHNVVADPYRNCLWIFTGDFGEAAAIWKVTDNFKKIECKVCNNQRFRACMVYVLPEGLLYATDAPFADNYIYLLDTETFEAKELYPIHGSCIYGCKWKDQYVFSSTVEGDGRNMSRMGFLFSRKRGEGIKDNYVHLYVGNVEKGFKEVYSEKKDCMPYYTFQFGVFKFPSGVDVSERLYFQPVATNHNDLKLLSIDLSSIL